MSALPLATSDLKVADEVYLVVAYMHRQNPEVEDFAVSEILDQARQLRITPTLRAGFEIHVRQHCVANLPPNPGRYRMLFASGKSRRRLFRSSDEYDPRRDGKTSPEPVRVPAEYRELVNWARNTFEGYPMAKSGFVELLKLRGSGKAVWESEPADEYMKRLRAGWD